MLFHADPSRAIFKGKTLLYMEESMARWLMAAGAIPWMLPRSDAHIAVGDLLDHIDGLLLQGGSDVSPATYGEVARKPEWRGDAQRDAYEIALVKGAMARDIPVFGICRGQQLLNVALGGTLVQDIAEDIAGSGQHRHWDSYEDNAHGVKIAEGSVLQQIFSGASEGHINSIHHQCVKRLGEGLVAEAISPIDNIIEAIRFTGEAYAAAVQWHPEFQADRHGHLLPADPLRDHFLAACAMRR